MLQGLLAIILIIILLFVIVFMLMVRFVFHGISRMREYFRVLFGMMSPDYRNDHDYTGRRTNQYSFSSRNKGRTNRQDSKAGNAGDNAFGGNSGTTYSTTNTETGTTIIDRHAGERKQRKIFSENEGEYVSFEEE